MDIPEQVSTFVNQNENITFVSDIVPNKSANWITTESNIPWLLWDDTFPYKEMAEEARVLYDMGRFVEHRNTQSRGWKSVCIHGMSAEKTNTHRYYGFLNEDDVHYDWTDIVEFCPITVDYFKNSCPYWAKYKRLRFMALEPYGYIEPHTDSNDGKRGLKAVNYALTNPEKCKFYMEGYGIVPFKEGLAYRLDLGLRHVVVNLSDEVRFHIIAHVVPKIPEIDQKVIDCYYR